MLPQPSPRQSPTYLQQQQQQQQQQPLQKASSHQHHQHQHHHHREERRMEVASGHCAKGREHWTDGNYQTALECFGDALQILEGSLGMYHVLTAKTYYWVGFIQKHLDQNAKALQSFTKTARIRCKLLGSSDESFQEAVAAIQWILQQQQPSSATTTTTTPQTNCNHHNENYLRNLMQSIKYESKGDAAWKQQQQQQDDFAAVALSYYNKACQVFDDPEHAAVLFKKALCLSQMDQIEPAIVLYRKAIKIFLKSIHGTTHPEIPNTVDRLLQALNIPNDDVVYPVLDSVQLEYKAEQTKDVAQARTQLQAALDIEKSVLGHNHVVCQQLRETISKLPAAASSSTTTTTTTTNPSRHASLVHLQQTCAKLRQEFKCQQTAADHTISSPNLAADLLEHYKSRALQAEDKVLELQFLMAHLQGENEDSTTPSIQTNTPSKQQLSNNNSNNSKSPSFQIIRGLQADLTAYPDRVVWFERQCSSLQQTMEVHDNMLDLLRKSSRQETQLIEHGQSRIDTKTAEASKDQSCYQTLQQQQQDTSTQLAEAHFKAKSLRQESSSLYLKTKTAKQQQHPISEHLPNNANANASTIAKVVQNKYSLCELKLKTANEQILTLKLKEQVLQTQLLQLDSTTENPKAVELQLQRALADQRALQEEHAQTLQRLQQLEHSQEKLQQWYQLALQDKQEVIKQQVINPTTTQVQPQQQELLAKKLHNTKEEEEAAMPRTPNNDKVPMETSLCVQTNSSLPELQHHLEKMSDRIKILTEKQSTNRNKIQSLEQLKVEMDMVLFQAKKGFQHMLEKNSASQISTKLGQFLQRNLQIDQRLTETKEKMEQMTAEHERQLVKSQKEDPTHRRKVAERNIQELQNEQHAVSAKYKEVCLLHNQALQKFQQALDHVRELEQQQADSRTIRDAQDAVSLCVIDKESCAADKSQVEKEQKQIHEKHLLALESIKTLAAKQQQLSEKPSSIGRMEQTKIQHSKNDIEETLRDSDHQLTLLRQELLSSTVQFHESTTNRTPEIFELVAQAKQLNAQLEVRLQELDIDIVTVQSGDDAHYPEDSMKYEDYNSLFTNLRREIEALELDKVSLRSQLTELHKDNAKISQQVYALKHKKERVMQEKVDQSMQISALEIANAGLETKLMETVNGLKTLKSERAYLQTSLEKNRLETQETELQERSLTGRHLDSQDTLKKARETFVLLQDSLITKVDETEVLRTTVEAISGFSLFDDRGESHGVEGYTSLSKRVLNSQEEKKKLNEQINFFSKNIAELERKTTELEEEKKVRQSESQSLQKDELSIESRIAKLEKALADFEAAKVSLTIKLNRTREQLNEAVRQLNEILVTAAKNESEIHGLKNLVTCHLESPKQNIPFGGAIRNKVASTMSTQEYERALEKAEPEIVNLRDQIEKLQLAKEKSNAAITKLESQNQSAVTLIRDLSEELFILAEKYDSIGLKYGKLKELVIVLETKKKVLKDQSNLMGGSCASDEKQKASKQLTLLTKTVEDLKEDPDLVFDEEYIDLQIPGLEQEQDKIFELTDLLIGEKQFTRLKNAVESSQYIYKSSAAVFTIRRPFGVGVDFTVFHLGSCCDAEPYAENAHVGSPSTIEVVATICDGSHLFLSQSATLLHKKSDGSVNEFGDLDSCDRPLGWVVYSKPDGTEGHYSLGR